MLKAKKYPFKRPKIIVFLEETSEGFIEKVDLTIDQVDLTGEEEEEDRPERNNNSDMSPQAHGSGDSWEVPDIWDDPDFIRILESPETDKNIRWPTKRLIDYRMDEEKKEDPLEERNDESNKEKIGDKETKI